MSTFKKILWSLLIGNLFVAPNALQCYHCVHVDGYLDEELLPEITRNFTVTPKCAKGTALTSDLLITCPDKIDGEFMSCGTQKVRLEESSFGYNISITTRGCLENYLEAAYCTNDMEDLNWYHGEEKSAKKIDPEVYTLQICKCTGTNCNDDSPNFSSSNKENIVGKTAMIFYATIVSLQYVYGQILT